MVFSQRNIHNAATLPFEIAMLANLSSAFALHLQAVIVYHAVQPAKEKLWQADFNLLPRFESVE